MKIDLENSKKWTDKERKKIKKRAITIGVLLGIIIISTVSLLITAYVRKTKGLFYPDVVLEDTTTGAEPKIIPVEGYTQVLKAPSLPYTMLVKGEVVSDSDSFCVFLSEGTYIVIAEVPTNATSETYLSAAIIPTLNGTVEETNSFKKQNGYLNERSVESQGITLTLNNKAKLYTMNMRVFMGGEKDILISVISPSTNMDEAEKTVEAIFYSLHYLEESSNANETTASNGNTKPDNNQGLGTGNGHENDDIEYDGNPYYDLTINEWEIPNPEAYIEGETFEYTLVADKNDSEWLAFVYISGAPKLKEIVAISPEGEIYQAESLKWFDARYAYGFHIGKNKNGETWKFVFTANGYIGEYLGTYATDTVWQTGINKEPMFE